MIIGRVLAWQLGVEVGDELTVMVPGRTCLSAGGRPMLQTFIVSGVFEVGSAGSRRIARAGRARRRGRARRAARRGPAGLRLRFDDVMQRTAARGRAACRAVRPGRGQRLDAGARRVFPCDPHREDDDEPDPAAGRRGRGVQHRRGAGHGRQREALRHCDSAHARPRARWRRRRVLHAGTRDRRDRHAARRAARPAASPFNVGTIVPALERVFGFHVMDPSVYYITEIPSDPQLRPGRADRDDRVPPHRARDDLPGARAARPRSPAEALRYE